MTTNVWIRRPARLTVVPADNLPAGTGDATPIEAGGGPPPPRPQIGQLDGTQTRHSDGRSLPEKFPAPLGGKQGSGRKTGPRNASSGGAFGSRKLTKSRPDRNRAFWDRRQTFEKYHKDPSRVRRRVRHSRIRSGLARELDWESSFFFGWRDLHRGNTSFWCGFGSFGPFRLRRPHRARL